MRLKRYCCRRLWLKIKSISQASGYISKSTSWCSTNRDFWEKCVGHSGASNVSILGLCSIEPTPLTSLWERERQTDIVRGRGKHPIGRLSGCLKESFTVSKRLREIRQKSWLSVWQATTTRIHVVQNPMHSFACHLTWNLNCDELNAQTSLSSGKKAHWVQLEANFMVSMAYCWTYETQTFIYMYLYKGSQVRSVMDLLCSVAGSIFHKSTHSKFGSAPDETNCFRRGSIIFGASFALELPYKIHEHTWRACNKQTK